MLVLRKEDGLRLAGGLGREEDTGRSTKLVWQLPRASQGGGPWGGGCRQAAIPTHPTNLAGETEQLLKSYLMSLLTKVHLVKAMVFPVVKYGCGNWIIKKAEG